MPDVSRPTAAALTGLAVDDWSALLAVALPVVRDLPQRLVDPTVQRLVAVPPGRLASGRSREDLARVLAREEVWDLVEAALPADAGRPWDDDTPPPTEDGGGDGAEVRRLEQQVEHLTTREAQLRSKVAELRATVDDLRRERDGAVARADAAEARARAAEAEVATARAAATEAAAAAAAADARIEGEVARTRRRDDAEVADLQERLRRVRRERDELRGEAAAARAEVERLRAAAAAVAAVAASDTPAGGAVTDDSGGRRGRPSRLPEGIAAGTRRAAEWLVADGRVLLVDGYNVTRTHRANLSFPDQRRWLEDAVATLAQRRHVDATIIWDSAHGTATTRRTRRGLTVRFTRAETSADDELVLHVQLALAPDTPVVVVTDDAELRTRLAQHGVDLLDSTSFTWLL